METQDRPLLKIRSDLENKLSSEMDGRSFVEKATDWYFAPKSFEKSGKLYESLGIKQFKKLVMGTIGKAFRKITIRNIRMEDMPGSYFIGKERNKKTIKEYELKARFNELIHAPLTIASGYELVKDLSRGDYSGAVLDGIAFLINGYGAILQRYNRTRVYKTLNKFDKITPLS